jgi:DEAD/DEAH box helicase domain-containing protein
LDQYLKELRKTKDIDIVLDTSEKKTDPTFKKLRPAFPKEIKPDHKLYTHQVDAINLIRKGKNVVITTPTSSGKSLAFTYPILEKILEDPKTTAIFIYPINALANDQHSKLLDKDFCKVRKYNGSLNQIERKEIRLDKPNILLTNPDMIHASLLRAHNNWENFLKNLKFIVIDEAHLYRGYFGSQVGNVFQRLIEIARLYDAEPQIISSSATIERPVEFLESLTNQHFHEVRKNGAGFPTKAYLLVDPREKDKEEFIVDQTKTLNENGVQTIVFCNTVNCVTHLHEIARQKYDNPQEVAAYHSKITTGDRVRIEAGLKSKSITTVFTTNALEVGIDIGSLGACILYGLPKSGFEAWQRIGRVGRTLDKTALIMVVKYGNAYDNYYFANPDSFLHSKYKIEEPVVYPQNPAIKDQHDACRVYEKTKTNPTNKSYGTYKRINLRGSWNDEFLVKDENNEVVKKITRDDIYIYFYAGAIYQPTSSIKYGNAVIDFDNKVINVSQMNDIDYITRAIRQYKIDHEDYQQRQCEIRYGDFTFRAGISDGTIVQTIRAFEKRYLNTKKTTEIIPIKRPHKWTHNSPILWIEFPRDSFPVDALRGILFTTAVNEKGYCDITDLHSSNQKSKIFYYEIFPENLKICEKIYANLTTLISEGAEKLANCPCEDGCLACIIAKNIDEYSEGDKDRLIDFLNGLLENEPEVKEITEPKSQKAPISIPRSLAKVGKVVEGSWRIAEVDENEAVIINTVSSKDEYVSIKDD